MGRELIARAIGGALAALSLAACGGPRIAAPDPSPDRDPARRETRAPLAERVRVRLLRVVVDETRAREQALERAEMLARTARADDFSDLAARYGDGEEPRRTELAAGGVEITADAPAVIPAPVRDAARALALHEISAPVEAQGGFWVLQRIE